MGRIRTSYEVITEESAAEGDAAWPPCAPGGAPRWRWAERGWVDEDGEVLGVNAAIEWLRSKGPLEPSSGGFHKGIWYSGPSEQDMYTGDYRQEAYHLAGFTEDQQRRIYEGVVAPRRRRNPHEQYYGDEEAPEDAERMRRLKAISDAAMGGRKNPSRRWPPSPPPYPREPEFPLGTRVRITDHQIYGPQRGNEKFVGLQGVVDGYDYEGYAVQLPNARALFSVFELEAVEPQHLMATRGRKNPRRRRS